MRSVPLLALEDHIKSWNCTQAEAAKRLEITQPRLNDLLKGRFEKFSLGALLDLAARGGLHVQLKVGGKRRKAA